ncbi:LAME_0D04984g1_1 [Lachancea meyersii CBS 8951]|uniref:Pre-mRNA-splicing factor ISY1 n=1 Tax=Lachancea meyersii CBS 8951 TaxID=1266667 RepID=A0A1G4J8F1_9SACH|nr:LAME_0D04984g1_1 [Lachancea meyersii CBS 8951]
MSRNVDKANSVLVRFQELEAEKSGGYKDYSRFKRPTSITSIKDSQEAQQWRRQVIQDINSKLTRMHDPSLNEIQLRELNDELNNLFSEKSRWERHIRNALKGPDFTRDKTFKFTGTMLKGRRYFGRALELSEVQELAKADSERRTKLQSTRQRQHALQSKIKTWEKTLGPDYYGFLPNEGKNFKLPLSINRETVVDLLTSDPEEESALSQYEEEWTLNYRSDLGGQDVIKKPEITIPSFDYVPDQKEMERWLVERRKMQLQKQLGL